VVALGSDGHANAYVDGRDPRRVQLATPASRLAGIVVTAVANTRLFVDDVAAAPGLLKPTEANGARRSRSRSSTPSRTISRRRRSARSPATPTGGASPVRSR
jgi:hypothetical protein